MACAVVGKTLLFADEHEARANSQRKTHFEHRFGTVMSEGAQRLRIPKWWLGNLT